MYSQMTSLAFTMFKESSCYSVNRMNHDQEIMSRLKLIGKLKKGEKLNTKYLYVQPNGFGTSLSRTFFYQDNRGNALNFCQEAVERAFDLLNSYKISRLSSERALVNVIITDLQQSMTGITNLKSTYISDVKFTCDMDTLLEDITAKLEEFTRKSKEKPDLNTVD